MQAKGFDPVYGARPVKRAVQRELETSLAKALLRGDFVEEDTVVVEAPGGEKAEHLVLDNIPGPFHGNGLASGSMDIPAALALDSM